VHEVSHSGVEPAHIVLAVRHPDHTQLSQSLLHIIMLHEADSAAQRELNKHLKGGADKLGNVLPHYTWTPDDPAIAHHVTTTRHVE